MAKTLFQQFIVDAFAQVDQQQLSWLRHHQKELRAELYSGLVDAVQAGDTNISEIGQHVILPSSYIGGPRHMFQLY
jgi:hypothetical protein